MKKNRHLNFRSKLSLLISGFLVVFFLIMIAAVQLVSKIYTADYVDHNVYVQQERCDSALNTLFVDTNANLIKLFSTENLVALDTAAPADRDALFKSLYTEKSFSPNIYGGVSYYQSGILSAQSSIEPLIDRTFQAEVDASPQYLVYVKTERSEGENYLVFGKKIETERLAFVFLREQVVLDFLNNILATGYSFLVAGDSYVVSYPDPTVSGSNIFDRQTFHIDRGQNYSVGKVDGVKSLLAVGEMRTVRNSFGLNWKVVSVVPYDDLFAMLDFFRIVLLVATVVMLTVAVILALRVSKSVVRPLQNLSEKVESFKADDRLDNYVPLIKVKNETSRDEIYRLEESYDAMIGRIYDLMEKNIRDMEEKRRLELDSLQQQINPHFLYNTLDAIAWMAKIKKEPEIESLVMSLAKFFRISLHRGDKIITVGEEVELTQHYLEIEQIRFPDRFTISYDIDPEVKNLKTLKLILQPIVENAIKYGMADSSGTIRISVKKDGGKLIFQVLDNGTGFVVPSDILARPGGTFDTKKSGFGLFNVNERIRLEYGEPYGLKISSAPNKGTKVQIIIPVTE